jgi:fluoroquinolone transport system ATP-binding protein
VIDVRDLTFRYPDSSEPALRSIDFRVERGEIFGFLGPSGAGKSTAQKILIRLLRDYEGTVKVLDRDLSAWGNDYYERIGVSFEVPNHYLKLTALENLAAFRGFYSGATEDPRALLEAVGLSDDADKRVAQFSKGMRLRLNVARSLLNRPELLFLDEPTSGLDPVTSRLVRDLVRERREQGTTVVLTTHNMTIADELCDRVAFLVDGRIELVDAPRTLKLRHGRRFVRVELDVEGRLESREFPLDGLGDNPEFLATLRDHAVQTIHTQETTLEDIFIQLTGRTLS